jgi:hypothetical protein
MDPWIQSAGKKETDSVISFYQPMALEYTAQESKNVGLHVLALTLAFVKPIYNNNNRLIRLLRNLLQRFKNQLLQLQND